MHRRQLRWQDISLPANFGFDVNLEKYLEKKKKKKRNKVYTSISDRTTGEEKPIDWVGSDPVLSLFQIPLLAG